MKSKDKKENGSRIENINRSIREKENSNNKTASENSKFIKNIISAFTQMDIKRIGIVLAAILTIILFVTLVIPTVSKAKYEDAYQVYLNNKSIGVMKDVTDLEAMLTGIYDEHEAYYKMEVARDVSLDYIPVRIEKQYLCPSKYYEDILRNNLEVNVIAWVILVNNTPVLALEQRADAQWVLEQLLVPYQSETDSENRSDIGFLESVEIKSEAINFNKVLDKETALRIMQYGDDIDIQMHKVVSGETLYSICKSYGLKLSDIKKANPSLSDDGKIYKGDLLIVTKINNIVNIKYTEYQERQEKMPFETIIVEDDTLYETQAVVRQEGITGLRDIKANVVFINGSEVSYEVLMADNPTREPVDEILVKGTKEMPYVLVLAKQGKMSFPLSSYTITSPFGTRDTGIEGASTFHNGIDLAAPYGTPIYASEDGKVSFAGSSGGYGLLVKIKHDGGVETRYGHCSQLLVKSGQYVTKGEIIALVGSTGTSSGNHVHFEVRINGTPVDPMG